VILLSLSLGLLCSLLANAQVAPVNPLPLQMEGSADGPVNVATSESPHPSEVDEYIQDAERNNPGLKAAFHRWQAALQKIPQVTSLEDPQLTFREYLERTMETREELEVMQMIPYPGKQFLRGQVESAEADALRREMEKNRLELRVEVRDAFYEYYYLEQTLRINRENLNLLKRFESVATARYGVGTAGNADVLKVQVELGKMENEVRNLEDSRIPVQARLNAAMDRPSTTPLPPPGEIDLVGRGTACCAPTETEQLLSRAFRQNPELLAIDARIRKAMDQVALAQKDYYPDFTMGLNWMNSNPASAPMVEGEDARGTQMGDEYMVTLGMNLPIYRKRIEAGVREAESEVREIQNMRLDSQNRIAVDLQTALYKLRNAERQIKLLAEALIPRAKQSLEVTETAYSTGRSTFLELIDTERELLMFQENYYRSVADYMQALAKIESLVGRSF
jgi:outer membrane protein TolC